MIEHIADLGGGDVLSKGRLRPRPSDGAAVIGEVLWIRGSSFGRQPTVTVGGRSAAVLSRTADGGILVRVPIGTPVGQQPVVVSHARGRASLSIQIRRHATILPAGGGMVAFATVGSEGPAPAQKLTIPGAAFLALSPDARAAYAIGGAGGALTVIELPSPGGPQVVDHVDLGKGRVVGLCAASSAQVGAVVREGDLVMLDISAALRPVRATSRPLPTAVRSAKVLRARMSPNGRLLAIMAAEGNRIFLVDIGGGVVPAVLATAEVARDARVRVLVDLAFSPDGQTLWVLSGDTEDSRATGPQPTRVLAYRIVQGRALELARTVTIASAQLPTRLSVGRAPPLASGATIRLPPEKATVYVSAKMRGAPRAAVFAIGADDRANEILTAEGPIRFGGVDMTPDGRWLWAALSTESGAFGITSAPADGRPGSTTHIDLGASPGRVEPGRDHSAAEIQIQP